MTSFPFPSQVIQPDAEQAARRLRLPFSCCAWKGTQGHWEGTGAGNSIDFQGSRSYQWGDDPRDIHWAAYARTGQLTMKVFRAELSPQVDVAVDVSESMFFHEERAARTRGLLQFCLLSAIGTGAQVKIHAVKGRRIIPLDQEDVLSGQWEAQLQSLPPDESMPSISIWRPNGMKIFISDLLYPGEPDNLLETMASLKGMSVILAPTLLAVVQQVGVDPIHFGIIMTLALAEVIRNALMALKSTIKIDITNVYLFGVNVNENAVYLLITFTFILLMLLTSNLIRSPIGRAMIAMKSSTSAAQAMGVSLMKYRLMAFVISTINAALGGLLYMLYVRNMTTATSTLLTLSTSLNILGAVIIGGAKSLWGTAFGTFVIYGLQSMFLSKIQFFIDNPAFITMVTGVLIIVVVMFFPGGFAQMVVSLRSYFKKKSVERRLREYGKD